MASLPASNQTASSGDHRTYRGSFTIMTGLCFMWGILAVFNDILIPRFKQAFALYGFQGMLVLFTPISSDFVLSAATGDPIAKIGYKNGVVIGLLLLASGSVIFWPAASATSYPLFLTGLFAVGLTFAVLRITASPCSRTARFGVIAGVRFILKYCAMIQAHV